MSRLRAELRWGDGRRWRGHRSGLLVLKGSAWVTAAKPTRRSTIGKFNTQHRVKLYNIATELRAGSLLLDLEGVRHRDVAWFCEEFLGVEAGEYEVAYYRRYERYAVLAQPDAWELARQRGFDRLALGGGRLARVEFLFKEVPVDVEGVRAKVSLTLYRVRPSHGATAPYKLEARMRAKQRDKNTFSRNVAEQVLDQVLAEALGSAGVEPIVRPERWEGDGRLPERVKYDPELRRLAQSAVQGPVLSWRSRSPFHPPQDASEAWKLFLRGSGTGSVTSSRITCPDPVQIKPEYDALAEDVASNRVNLISEIILDPDEDPGFVAAALYQRLGGPGEVALGTINTVASRGETWSLWSALMLATPSFSGHEKVLVAVVEPEIVAGLVHFEGLRDEGTPESLVIDMDALHRDLERAYTAQTSGHANNVSDSVFDWLEELRFHAEQTGLKIVLITAENFPENKASKAPDAPVRSILGHAGQHHPHVRYHVTRNRIVTWKDERRGRQGRIVWQREGPAADLFSRTSAKPDDEPSAPPRTECL